VNVKVTATDVLVMRGETVWPVT